MGVKLVVFGIGNTLKMDDGIGVYLVNELKNIYTEEEVKVYEIGIQTWRILPIIEEEKCEDVLIIDAINFGYLPGMVYIAKNPKFSDFCFFSLHEKSYLTDLFIIKKNIYIFGIEPYKIDWGYGLSDLLREKFDEIFLKLCKFCDFIINKEKENDLFRVEKY
jgi:hydrogenase maturation protease